VPVQERAERRVAAMLGHAEALIGEVGQEAATMTGIAERSGTSIGAIYQYFPNKEAIIQALRDRYSRAIEAGWDQIDSEIECLDGAEIARRLLAFMLDFATERPAFFVLFNPQVDPSCHQAARERKRERMANMFRKKNPRLTPEEALRVSRVTLQTIKGLYLLLGESKAAERAPLERAYRELLGGFLRRELDPDTP